MQSKSHSFFKRDNNGSSAVAAASSTMSAAAHSVTSGAMRTFTKIGSNIPRRLTSDNQAQGSFGITASANISVGTLLVKSWKATDRAGKKTLVCPCKSSEVLKFRSIADRGAAICHVCGDMFNGIVVRCARHDFNVCMTCHGAYYHLPSPGTIDRQSQVKCSTHEQHADMMVTLLMSHYPINAYDSNNSPRTKQRSRFTNTTARLFGSAADLNPQLSNKKKPKPISALSKAAERVLGQALGRALWYSSHQVAMLATVVERTSIIDEDAKGRLLDTLLCLCCMADPGETLDRHAAVVQMILGSCAFANPATHDNIPVGLAAANGHERTVRLLLQEKRVNACADDNFALRAACMNGHTKIVTELLKDARSDPSVKDGYALRIACKKGFTPIVKILIKSKRVQPDILFNTPVGMAAANGQLDVVRLLMKDRRVDAHDFAEYALRQAICNGHQRIAEVLVMDSTIAWAIGFAQSQQPQDKAMVGFLIQLENTRKHRLAVDTDLTGDYQLLNKGLKKVASVKKHKKKKKKKKSTNGNGGGGASSATGDRNGNSKKSGEKSK